MTEVNWTRVVLGGVVAAIVANIGEMILAFSMRSEWEAAMKSMKPPGPAVLAAHFLWSFVIEIAAIWLYAAVRPRYGPGLVTACRIGFVVWLFAHATFALAASTMALLPEKIMLASAVWSLPETLVATIAGAWVYRAVNRQRRWYKRIKATRRPMTTTALRAFSRPIRLAKRAPA